MGVSSLELRAMRGRKRKKNKHKKKKQPKQDTKKKKELKKQKIFFVPITVDENEIKRSSAEREGNRRLVAEGRLQSLTKDKVCFPTMVVPSPCATAAWGSPGPRAPPWGGTEGHRGRATPSVPPSPSTPRSEPPSPPAEMPWDKAGGPGGVGTTRRPAGPGKVTLVSGSRRGAEGTCPTGPGRWGSARRPLPLRW